MPISLPTSGQKATLMGVAQDLIDAWIAPGDEESFDDVTQTWGWNEAEVTAPHTDWKMGPSALAATVYRFRRPMNPSSRRRYRQIAINSIDRWFTDFQDPVTGGMFWTTASNVASEEGQATAMGLSNVAIAVKCLGPSVRYRWVDQILAALDYSKSRNQLTFYTNGNIILYRINAFELGAYVTDDDVTRRADVNNTWSFLYTPTEFVGDPLKWRGRGYIQEVEDTSTLGPNERGYFSETTLADQGADMSGDNRFDAIYTDVQAYMAALGYLLWGDTRYVKATNACSNKMLPVYNATTNLFSYTGGSRNPGLIQRQTVGANIPMLAWLFGNQTWLDRVDTFLSATDYGVDPHFRQFLAETDVNYMRQFGTALAACVIAAHGRPIT